MKAPADKPRPRWWVPLMLGAYAVLCAAEFVLGKAKDWVGEQIWGEEEEEDDDED
jgi:hypothetical protein